MVQTTQKTATTVYQTNIVSDAWGLASHQYDKGLSALNDFRQSSIAQDIVSTFTDERAKRAYARALIFTLTLLMLSVKLISALSTKLISVYNSRVVPLVQSELEHGANAWSHRLLGLVVPTIESEPVQVSGKKTV